MVNSNTLIYQSKFIGFFDFNTRTYRLIMISFILLSHLCSIKHTVELYFYVDHLFCILTPLLELKKNEYVILKSPKQCLETYCFCSVSYYYYYYVTPNAVGWRIAILRFFFTIIIIILPHIFVRSISRRCLDQTLWNLVRISYAMWSCAGKSWFFQNGCHCHGNGQNAKKLKNTKMIIASYSPNRNWW
jgi:hypothetical protein